MSSAVASVAVCARVRRGCDTFDRARAFGVARASREDDGRDIDAAMTRGRDDDVDDDDVVPRRDRRAMLALVASATTVASMGADRSRASPVRSSTRAADRAPPTNAVRRAACGPGYASLRDASAYRGLATNDRRGKGVDGLIPAGEVGEEVEIARANAALAQCETPFEKYKQLVALQMTDESTFYRMLRSQTETLLPILYTPTVGEACVKFGTLVQRPMGLWVSSNDAGNVKQLIRNWPATDVKIAVITDGERILGLGDQGANGMGISAGKSMVYAACGVPPSALLPIQVDTGTNNQTLLDDPLYIGLKQKRDRTKAYDALLDEIVVAVRSRYGQKTIIHWEDFAPKNAFRVLRRFQQAPEVVTYNDDIQGTAAVTVSGLLASVRSLRGDVTQQRVLFFGAGQANIGAAELFVSALVQRGVSEEEAKKRVWLFDSKGLVVRSRASQLSEDKLAYAQDAPEESDLERVIELIKPTALVGAAAVPGKFNERVVKKMSKINDRPIIFALSNPTSQAECSAEQAYAWSDGRAIFASGTRFPPVTYRSRKFEPGFANNAFIFPPIALATIVTGTINVTPEMFLTAAEALAESVDDELFSVGAVYPPVDRIASSARVVAARVAHAVDPSISLEEWTDRVDQYVRKNDLFSSVS